MKAKHKTYTPQAIDVDGIFEAQTLGGAGNVVLDGAEVVDGVWATTDGLAHKIAIDSAGDVSGVVFTITGTDPDGQAITDTITGVTTTEVESTEYFLTITQIAADGAVASAINGGAVDTVAAPMIPLERRAPGFGLFVDLVGTATFTVQHTGDNINPYYEGGATWYNNVDIVNKAVSSDGNYDFPPTATRLQIEDYTAGAVIEFHITTKNQNP